jgi:ribosomal protein S18 acetylase RimI-like enzyme
MYLLFFSYFFALLIIFYLFMLLYLKCKMPFWSKQPVFHWYNLTYWISGPPGHITKELPLVNKYVDLFNIKTFSLTDENIESEQMTTFCEFIRENYIYTGTNKSTMYTPTKANILDYLLHSNHLSYVTVYQEPKLCVIPEKDGINKDIIAVISARPLYVRLNEKTLFGSDKTMFTTYYVDNLCVHPAYRKKGIASTMIQTHYYNLRQQNKHITTCLFKREGDLNAIVPLVAFNTYCLPLANLVNNLSAPHHSLIEIGITQLYLCMEFIKSQMKTFKCVILPDVTSLTHLIKTGNIRIYCLVDKTNANGVGANGVGANGVGANGVGANGVGANGVGANGVGANGVGANGVGANGVGANGVGIIACYIFRLLELTYDGQKVSECIATLNATNTLDLFQYGFHQACSDLKEKHKTTRLLLEETAHSSKLLTPTIKSLVQFTSPTAFFFYNYACYSLKGKECLIIY